MIDTGQTDTKVLAVGHCSVQVRVCESEREREGEMERERKKGGCVPMPPTLMPPKPTP